MAVDFTTFGVKQHPVAEDCCDLGTILAFHIYVGNFMQSRITINFSESLFYSVL